MRNIHGKMPAATALLLTVAVLLPGLAMAKPSLLAAVPGDAIVVSHSQSTDKDDLIHQYWGEFFDSVLATGVVDDIVGLLKSNMPPSEFEQANAVFIQVRNLVTAIDWKSLGAQETAFAMRWEDPSAAFIEKTRTWTNADGTTGSAEIKIFRAWPSQVFLFRQTPEALDRNFTGFKSIFQTIAGLDASLSYNEEALHGGTIGRLDVGGVIQFAVARHGDVLAIGMNSEMIEESLALMADPSSGSSILANERFTSMVGLIPEADTDMAWADFDALFTTIRGLFDSALEKASGEVPQDADEINMVRALLDRLFDEVSFIDRSYTTIRWESELRTVTETITTVNPEGTDSFIFQALANQGTFEEFHTLVPRDTQNFSFNSGINFLALYDGIKAAATDLIPEAGEGFAEFEAELQKELGLDIRTDVLGWISGEMVSIALPSPPMGGQNAALMIGVSDQEKALDAISGGLSFIDEQLKGNGQAGLSMNPAPGKLGEKGFITLFHPFLAMAQMTPVIGVDDDYLVIGFTTHVLDQVYKTAAGEAPSIAENARFQAEGLTPDGPASAISYQDLEKAMLDMQMGLNMMVPMLGMAAAGAGPEGAVLGQLVQSLQKVLPTLGQLNFFKSRASVTTFDGETWHMKSVTNYKRK